MDRQGSGIIIAYNLPDWLYTHKEHFVLVTVQTLTTGFF